MVFPLLLAVVGVGAVSVSVVAFFLWRINRQLAKEILTRKADLDRTSKILIEKNLELVDQNLSQQRLLESKDDFISIVSHQLRTPVTEVKWNVDSILKDPAWKLAPSQRASLETLYASIEHTIRLINEIVQLVSIEQGAAHLAVVPYDVDGLVHLCAQKVKQKFDTKHVQLSIDASYGRMNAAMDEDSLSMVVMNLIENAFYYTPEGGTVTVRTLSEGRKYKVTVADTGIGMSPEQQKTVFTKFRRGADAIQVNARGSGLGLYIVKKIVEEHNGTVTFESAERVGTTFTLLLPEDQASA